MALMDPLSFLQALSPPTPRPAPAAPPKAPQAPAPSRAEPAVSATPANAASLGMTFAEPMRPKRAERDLVLQPPRVESRIVSLSRIRVDDAWNCRGKIDEATVSFQELAESLRSGLQQPLKVTPIPGSTTHYSLVSGFRRFKGLTKIGCLQALCIVAYYEDPISAVLDNLLENMHRERLRPFEIARAISGIHQKGFTLRSISKHVGLSPQHVGNLVRCHERLIPPLKEVFRRQDSETTLTELIGIASLEPQAQLVKYQEISGRSTQPKSPQLSSPYEDEPPKKKPPKMKSREQIEDFLIDLHHSSAIKKLTRGSVPLDDEVREAVASALRWATGDTTGSPLVLEKAPKTAA